jgi:hypothetical protein
MWSTHSRKEMNRRVNVEARAMRRKRIVAGGRWSANHLLRHEYCGVFIQCVDGDVCL